MREFSGAPHVRRELLETVLRASKCVRLTVTGPSMGPTIESGDAVELRPLTRAPRRGEIYLFQSTSGHFYVHRLMETVLCDGKEFYIFKGDGLTLADLPVPPQQILGRVSAVWRQATAHFFRIPVGFPGFAYLLSWYFRFRPWFGVIRRYIASGADIPSR